jgi:hypothetical protein
MDRVFEDEYCLHEVLVHRGKEHVIAKQAGELPSGLQKYSEKKGQLPSGLQKMKDEDGQLSKGLANGDKKLESSAKSTKLPK